jgi:hypothetical protein
VRVVDVLVVAVEPIEVVGIRPFGGYCLILVQYSSLLADKDPAIA